ncbi:MAG: AAA family ATPase [Caldilineaceae bacterium]|nr:AAA family ATPase [Caldilineaceae bacterium]
MSYYPEFARLLNDELIRKDRTASWLAQRVGVSPTTVTRWLNHGTRPGAPEIIAKIADVLGINTQRQSLLIAAGYGYQPKTADDESRMQLNQREPPSTQETANNLPSTLTSFVGRTREISELLERLQDPTCRLLTLIGPGGVGKTRLAIAVAARQSLPVVYVPLQAVSSPDLLPSAIADSVGLRLSGPEPLAEQLVQRLRGHQLLLVLDNFEHLLGCAELLDEILQQAPAVKFLITSREVIQLREEWLYLVPGLPVPSPDEQGDPSAYGAVQLFNERALQTRHAFVLEDQLEAVIAICRSVQGMPLAIELAAGWLTVLDCSAIASQVRHNLDLLSSSLRNVPARHRSIRAVFDGSWQMLGAPQRDTLMQLALFQGGFTFEAASAVAGATLANMAEFVAKSLLGCDGKGRYQMHELLRQYAGEKLAALPERMTAGARAHSDFYMRFLVEQTYRFTDARQRQAGDAVGQDLENVRKAWQWAVDNRAIEAMHASGWTFHHFFQHRSRYLEGAKVFRQASESLEINHLTVDWARTLAAMLTHYSYFCIRLGQLDDADRALLRVRQLCDEYNFSPAPGVGGHPNAASMFLELARGNYGQAAIYGEQTLKTPEQIRPPSFMSIIHYGMASAALAQEQYVRAKEHAGQGLAVANAYGNQRNKALLNGTRGQIALAMGDLQEAKYQFEAARVISEELTDPGGIAEQLANLADIAMRQHKWRIAHEHYRRSLRTYEQIGDRGGIARAQLGLGSVAYKSGEPAATREHYRVAFMIANEIQVMPLLCSVLAEVAEFLLQGDETRELGLRVSGFVLYHPACEALTRQRLLDSLSYNGISATTLEPTSTSLEEIIASLQTVLV